MEDVHASTSHGSGAERGTDRRVRGGTLTGTATPIATQTVASPPSGTVDPSSSLAARSVAVGPVAVGPDGRIYTSDCGAGLVVEVTSSTSARVVAGSSTPAVHHIAPSDAPGPPAFGDGGPATSAHLNMPSDVAIAPSGDIYIADMHHQRVRKVDARTRIITTVAGSGAWGHAGDGGPATQAAMAGPAGLAIVPEPQGQIAIFIADYYNGRVRAVTPDGIIRDVGEDARVTFGEPTRVAFAPKRGLLWVADSSRDRLVSLSIRRTATATTTPLRLLKAPGTAPKGAGG